MKDHIHSAQILVTCLNLNRTLEFFTERLGFRVEMIYPADAPSVALISGYGVALRLESSDEIQPVTLRLLGKFSDENPREIYSPDNAVRIIFVNAESKIEIPDGKQEFIISMLDDENSWSEGRAGMLYRDLIPGRLGGRFVASHISIPAGGEIPDYVHYHKIRFQMIYCLSGWARLVYEDYGEPFLMKEGDCVLQPPEIRHRVLETSAKFEVLEIGCPAIHETFADHEMTLPNNNLDRTRIFGGNQRFVHHAAENAVWNKTSTQNLESRETEIAEATNNLADVKIFRAVSDAAFSENHSGEFLFFFVLKGIVRLNAEKVYYLKRGDVCILPAETRYLINADESSEFLRVYI